MKKLILILILFGILSLSSCKKSDSIESYEPYFIGLNQEIRTSSNPLPTWLKDSVIYEVNLRQYTNEGTFNAFLTHLPRLKNLGIDVLWLMPIHEISLKNRKGSLGSYYAVKDYYSINPEFGSVEAFDEFISIAKQLGFKIVLDMVFNHTGADHLWTNTNKEYYTRINNQFISPLGTDWTDVIQIDTENEAVINEFKDILNHYIKTYDIDGFRFDYASAISNDTWEKLKDHVMLTKKDIFFLAEDDSKSDWFDTFHANYGGWGLLEILKGIKAESKDQHDLKNYLINQNKRYPNGNIPLNFITNHDINSWEETVSDRFLESKDLMVMLTFLLPGMPLIYSGLETSDEHMLSFFEKDLIRWGNYAYEPFLKELIILKKEHPSLHNDNYTNSTYFLHTLDDRIFSFIRYDQTKNDFVLVISNLSNDSILTDVHLNSYKGIYLDDSNNEIKLNEVEQMTLKPFEYKIYTK